MTPWIAACQVPLSMGFSQQEYWSALPFPSPGDLPRPGIKPATYDINITTSLFLYIKDLEFCLKGSSAFFKKFFIFYIVVDFVIY